MQSSASLVAKARKSLAERSDVPTIIKAGEEICKHLSQIFEEQGLHKKRFFGGTERFHWTSLIHTNYLIPSFLVPDIAGKLTQIFLA